MPFFYPPPTVGVSGLLLLLLLSVGHTPRTVGATNVCDDFQAGLGAPACVEPPMHLLPNDARETAPRLFSCEGPDGPVRYGPPAAWAPKDSQCADMATVDFFLFSGASDRHLLPFLFASMQSFMKCFNNFHVAVPLHEVNAILPFLPEDPRLQIHTINIPPEVCNWEAEGRPWSLWKVLLSCIAASIL